MYSRNTDRGGRRIKLPPGYDGSAFRHDTGEIRQYAAETEMKIHSPAPASETERTVEEKIHDAVMEPLTADPHPHGNDADIPDFTAGEGERCLLPPENDVLQKKTTGESSSFLEGLLAGLGSEEWLLFLVILLLLADGSDAWDIIVLLGLLLAVR